MANKDERFLEKRIDDLKNEYGIVINHLSRKRTVHSNTTPLPTAKRKSMEVFIGQQAYVCFNNDGKNYFVDPCIILDFTMQRNEITILRPEFNPYDSNNIVDYNTNVIKDDEIGETRVDAVLHNFN